MAIIPYLPCFAVEVPAVGKSTRVLHEESKTPPVNGMQQQYCVKLTLLKEETA